MKADYVHKDSRTLEEKPQVFTRWIDPTIKELKQENQELKLELSGYRQAILNNKEMLGLKQENQKYKEVIDKAIEYIESKEYEYGDEEQDNYIYDIGFDEINELLDILKGMK